METFTYQEPNLIATKIFCGQTWTPVVYVYDQHRIASTTPGSGSLTTIKTLDPHNLTNGDTARVIITDGINTVLNGAWVATVVDAYTFTIPAKSYNSGTANGKCGLCIDLTGASWFYALYTQGDVFVIQPSVTANPTQLLQGQLNPALTGAQTKALRSYSSLKYDFFVETAAGVFYDCASGPVPIVPNVTQTLP